MTCYNDSQVSIRFIKGEEQMAKLTKKELKTIESREDYIVVLEARISDWAPIDEEEKKRIRSIRRALNNYITYAEDSILD